MKPDGTRIAVVRKYPLALSLAQSFIRGKHGSLNYVGLANGVSPPVRIAINPLLSTIGWMLPAVISGETLVSIVLNIPTSDPVLLNAFLGQDMFLAGSFVLTLSFLTVLGTLISDILLVW